MWPTTPMVTLNEFAQLADINLSTFKRWVKAADVHPVEGHMYFDKQLTDVLFRHPLCVATIYKPDVPRYTGRGKSGFEMHYSKVQCSRFANDGEFCWQHKK